MKEFAKEIQIARRATWVALWICAALGILAYLLSGFYVVNTQETAVRFRFGRIVDDAIKPGPHYRMPWPFERVVKLGTRDMKRFQAGFGANPEDVSAFEREVGRLRDIPYGNFIVPYCLSGDKNILHAKVVVNYQIEEPPGAYLVNYRSPERALTLAVQAAINEVVSQNEVDFILTTGRPEIQRAIDTKVKDMGKKMHLGLLLHHLEIKNTRPPTQVEDAFRDVINAYEDKVRAKHDAESISKQILNDARGQEARALAEAQGYKDTRIKEAEGEAQRFLLLAEEYAKEKQLTEERLRLDTIAYCLERSRLYVLDEEDGNEVVHLKLFPQSDWMP